MERSKKFLSHEGKQDESNRKHPILCLVSIKKIFHRPFLNCLRPNTLHNTCTIFPSYPQRDSEMIRNLNFSNEPITSMGKKI